MFTLQSRVLVSHVGGNFCRTPSRESVRGGNSHSSEHGGIRTLAVNTVDTRPTQNLPHARRFFPMGEGPDGAALLMAFAASWGGIRDGLKLLHQQHTPTGVTPISLYSRVFLYVRHTPGDQKPGTQEQRLVFWSWFLSFCGFTSLSPFPTNRSGNLAFIAEDARGSTDGVVRIDRSHAKSEIDGAELKFPTHTAGSRSIT